MTTAQITYFETVVESAAEKLRALPKKASGATRLLAENRYAYAVRCYNEAVSGQKWLPRPEPDDSPEGT